MANQTENKRNPKTDSGSNIKQNPIAKVGKTLWRWLRRMFLGASKELSQEAILEVERLESPSRLAVKAFFRRKLAVAALIILILLFLFVFIGPYFFPMDLTYTDPLQANVRPNYSMRSVPKDLAGKIRSINGYADFTVGVSKDNTMYIWGNTWNALAKDDYSDFPEEIREGNVLMASAGSDFVIAVTTEGKVVGWGNNNLGQYGVVNKDDPRTEMPEQILNGTVDPDKVQQLLCGYQATSMVIDGKLYMWGNNNACQNMTELLGKDFTNVQKVAMTDDYAVLLFDDGTIYGGNNTFFRQSAVSSISGKIDSFESYLADHKVVDIAATKKNVAFLTEEGEVLVWGNANYGETDYPVLPEGESFVKLEGGSRHFVGLTDTGKVYAWGLDDYGQADLAGVAAGEIFVGAKQTYLVDENGVLTESYGQRGYLFGTDSMGRDVLTRIVHGGKMTMTIGAVAVIVSSIIAIIIGCLSGYFGGWVDMLLMRVTEIFSAIPFLPFAMMLSYVIKYYPIGETMRIFIIMIILGLLSWTGLARMIRGQVLAEREKEFVIAAKSMGIRERSIAFKHILPNVISVILVSMTLDFAGCLLTESSLSYLGFGVQQPQPTWGNMLFGANNSIVIQNYWWQWLFPAIFLSIATISINIIGDTLRDVLDPKSSQEK